MSTTHPRDQLGERLSLTAALAMTLIAAVFGLPTVLFDFPSFPASIVGIGWKFATVAVLLGAFRLAHRRRPTAEDVGLVPTKPAARRERMWIALPAIAVLTLIATNWSQIPGLKELSGAGSGSSYDAGSVGLPLLVFELLVRYPITVLSEEVFFRGYLQPRLPVAAPVFGGLLFAIYHLQQFETIPSLIPFGIALGLLRWWLGSIWPGVVFHYAGNAMFILSLR